MNPESILSNFRGSLHNSDALVHFLCIINLLPSIVILPSFSIADCPKSNGAFCCSLIAALTFLRCIPPISTSLILTTNTCETLPSAIVLFPFPTTSLSERTPISINLLAKSDDKLIELAPVSNTKSAFKPLSLQGT